MTTVLRRCAILLCLGLLAVAPVFPQLDRHSVLDLAGARSVIAAAIAYADAHDAPGGAIAVVDAGGHLLAFERLDGTYLAAPRIAEGKARTAALFRRPTAVFEKLVNEGRTTMVTLPEFFPLQGGIPIVVGGEVVGAIGVSGAASAQQDEEIALAGAAAALTLEPETKSSAVTHLDRDRVAAAFNQGAALVEVPGYKVHASRRDAPGEAEIHERDTDIFYVLEGHATLVTGGTLVAGQESAPDELRGPRIENGEARDLVRGDVVVVPRGTPHWFSRVAGPFVYYVVKVNA